MYPLITAIPLKKTGFKLKIFCLNAGVIRLLEIQQTVFQLQNNTDLPISLLAQSSPYHPDIMARNAAVNVCRNQHHHRKLPPTSPFHTFTYDC